VNLRRRAIKRILSLLLIYNCFQCDHTKEQLLAPENTPQAIGAFLDTAADSQIVAINNMEWPLETPAQLYERELQLLSQAQISLQGKDQSYTFPIRRKSIPDERYPALVQYIWISPQPVRPGETYHLEVTIPEKGTYRAETTLPGDFEVLSPDPADTISIDEPLTVTWTSAAGAAGYRVILWNHVLDSSLFLMGTGPVKVYWSHQTYLFNVSDSLTIKIKHYYRSNYFEEPPFGSAVLLGAKLSIEALDAAYWKSSEINLWTYRYRTDYRIEPVFYSNFDQGYGIFCGVTKKVLHLKIPGGQK